MRALVQGLAERIWQVVHEARGGAGHHTVSGRYVDGTTLGGDAEFPVDVLAERATWDYLRERGETVAVYTESEGLRVIGDDPRHLLVVDPIDGTRGAAADLEMACVSIAAARFTASPTIGDIEYAILKEVKTGHWMYADADGTGIETGGYTGPPLPRLGTTEDPERMFWSLEFNGHPARLMIDAYGHLIDASANRGGVYVFNSASFSISRIITGQMDAYVDIGNRLLRDHPETEADFRRVGHGSVLHLFPYDIAASVYLAERAGVVITDAYGDSLHDTLLLDIGPANQRSCVAACTPKLHQALLSQIRW
ncbi:inositol monophosphatase family protein [Allostreptomyces psammosilenae]|uniref:Myo-inositol-1(Or 4)-monophosphatase n=1 Tax=Allostreptomyces psammosilenae TaxID=1892865 RepID=A0A853AAD8_9ACTN|nr:inositol monophosphatase family protein [Allostreptomyces psammosilenae]NYI07591.1 myo-inositol-1(or 4)-monophosphatase [Allostreptomyces psammosilenae]